ncbi:hypothetical protein F4821DRAFT_263810 [Hypoxylon rubiginosum]|uniref:Uncharacterized protein n=1 Tax=Hypoxylon rubiginosum TaxID=110542 RepID=A0ACC0CQ17_9PEZI|nr:hypothetical protein F4821DRAFT_263810 [Hypoxylon rubiginosum]
MQVTKFTITLLTAVSGVSAGCYTGGEDGHMGSGLLGQNDIDLACAYLAGDYSGHEEERYTCVRDSKGIRWDFALKKISDGYRKAGKSECEDGMKKEALSCQYGGKTSYTNWEYKADPQSGRCNNAGSS